MSANGDVMSFFQFSHPEAGSNIWYIKLIFSLRIAFHLTKTEIRTQKSLTELS